MSLAHFRSQCRSLLLAAALATLAACGGDDGSDPAVRSVVSFGDSLSDVGTYAAATGPAGGRFTINPGTIWVENIASRYGLAITPNIVGYGTNPATFSICPRAACTGYAQGGARVTDPNGIGKAAGALTLPLKNQIANHLAASGGRFAGDELVLVSGGSNDALVQLSAFPALAAAQGRDAALATVQNAMLTAANELLAYVRDDIAAKGAKRIVVVNVPNLSQTPFGQKTLDASGRQLVDALVNTFDVALEKGIRDSGLNVLFFDANAAFSAINAAPAASGFTNTTDTACDPLKIAAVTGGQVTNGSALFCNASTLTSAAETDNRFQFADGVHPTPLMHQLFADLVAQALKSRGWL